MSLRLLRPYFSAVFVNCKARTIGYSPSSYVGKSSNDDAGTQLHLSARTARFVNRNGFSGKSSASSSNASSPASTHDLTSKSSLPPTGKFSSSPPSTSISVAIEGSGSQVGIVPPKIQREHDGPTGSEPTRFGDWERLGRCSDF